MVIIEDILPEDTETLTFNIESVDTDRIAIEEGFSQKILHIVDNDGRRDYTKCIPYLLDPMIHMYTLILLLTLLHRN